MAEKPASPADSALSALEAARAQAERALRESEERFRTLTDGAPDGVVILRGPRIAFLNGVAARLLGLEEPSHALGRSIIEFMHPDDAATAEIRIRRLFETKQRHPEPAEYRSVAADGRERVVEISSIPTEYEGKPAVLAFARDVTERKAMHTRLVEADRMAALGVLSAGIAHEINNPLSYVLLNLEFLARELPKLAKDPNALDAFMVRVRDACHGAERVASIVRDLRTFARADEGEKRPIDVRVALESALNIASNELRQRAVLTRDYEPIPPVDANANRLEQVFLNLLMNAVQALPEKPTVTPEIRVVLRAAPGHVVITIEDNGSGIPEEIAGRIFDPFFTTKPIGVGTGLGLSICRSIVRALGGEIRAAARAQGGSAFAVSLPASSTALDSTPQRVRPPSIPPAARGRLLIVDDEVSVGRSLQALLEHEHDVALADSGNAALDAIANTGQTFDVIMCDLMMPGMSGMDLYEQIRRRHAGLEQRMVFMTGGASIERTREFLAGSANLTFEKPLDFDRLRRTLRKLVERTRSAEA
ncbi:MAG TPA: ATP-binding protein [Polyangiaceae bacterium]